MDPETEEAIEAAVLAGLGLQWLKSATSPTAPPAARKQDEFAKRRNLILAGLPEEGRAEAWGRIRENRAR